MRIHIMWVCVLTTVAVAVGQQTAPTDAEQAEGPAAEGLVHSAVGLIHAPADTPARAGRLVVLLLYAQRLDPRDAETCRLLAGVYESRNQPALAAKNLENCREALKHPCYEVDCRRLVLLLDQRERTEDRMALLEDMLADDNLPPSVRAVAAVKMARLHRGRGELRDARDAYERALALDPTNPDAAEGLLRVTENPTAADEVEALLRLLSGNPKAVAVAWDVASLLDSLGLHERALTFFEHAHRTAVAAGDEQALSAEFVTEYCNAMLNAGEHERAADLFGPVLQQFE
ncbi:MAG: tetratricopeptide repeat protein, partial [Planctomycetota bacterium]